MTDFFSWVEMFTGILQQAVVSLDFGIEIDNMDNGRDGWEMKENF